MVDFENDVWLFLFIIHVFHYKFHFEYILKFPHYHSITFSFSLSREIIGNILAPEIQCFSRYVHFWISVYRSCLTCLCTSRTVAGDESTRSLIVIQESSIAHWRVRSFHCFSFQESVSLQSKHHQLWTGFSFNIFKHSSSFTCFFSHKRKHHT